MPAVAQRLDQIDDLQQMQDKETSTSHFDVAMQFAQQREYERQHRFKPAPMTYKQALALQIVRDRHRALPPELQAKVTISRYLGVRLGIEPTVQENQP